MKAEVESVRYSARHPLSRKGDWCMDNRVRQAVHLMKKTFILSSLN